MTYRYKRYYGHEAPKDWCLRSSAFEFRCLLGDARSNSTVKTIGFVDNYGLVNTIIGRNFHFWLGPVCMV